MVATALRTGSGGPHLRREAGIDDRVQDLLNVVVSDAVALDHAAAAGHLVTRRVEEVHVSQSGLCRCCDALDHIMPRPRGTCARLHPRQQSFFLLSTTDVPASPSPGSPFGW